MRAVLSAFCVAGILATIVSATPLSREKRFAGAFAGAFPFGPAGMAYAGPGFNPYTATRSSYPYQGQRFNPFDIFGGDGFYMPFYVPFPSFPFPYFKNWYEGENVCKEEKIMNNQMKDDVIPDDWKTDMPRVSSDFSHEQESCQGNDKKYVCVKRVMGNNGESQIKATKYECCHGFVRDPTGAPGCIESRQPNPTGTAQSSNGKLTPNDPTYYSYLGNNLSGSSSSSVSSSSKGNVDKVPLQ